MINASSPVLDESLEQNVKSRNTTTRKKFKVKLEKGY